MLAIIFLTEGLGQVAVEGKNLLEVVISELVTEGQKTSLESIGSEVRDFKVKEVIKTGVVVRNSMANSTIISEKGRSYFITVIKASKA